MLFIRPVEDFSSQNPIVELVWDGFEVPLKDDDQYLRFFNIKTYSTLTSKRKDPNPFSTEVATGPEVALDPANDFLRTLSIEEQEKVAIAFLHAHLEIHCGKPDASDIEEVEDRIAEILDSLDLEIDLCAKTEEYVKVSNISIADMSDAGTRPQDTPEMTFLEPEAVVITAIAVFMKLISPIIGAFITKYMPVLDNEYKESHACTILTRLHRRKYGDLIVKLHQYLTKLVDPKLKIDATALYNGQTLAKAARHAVDTAIVKRLVCVSLYRADGNIIKYLACCGRGSAESQQKNIAATNAAKIIADPIEQEKDEGNTSRMEVESRQSAKTADTPIILGVIARQVWKNVAARESIDPEALESVRAYYRRNPIVVNCISQYLLCMFYGGELGGGSSILQLIATTVSDLGAVLQLVFAQNGAASLAHVISANVAEAPRLGAKDDYIFSNMWKSSVEYAECKKILPAGFGDREWNCRLVEIANFLMQRTLVYNTAPVVWDLCEETPRNEVAITNFTEIMLDLMKFVKYTFVSGRLE